MSAPRTAQLEHADHRRRVRQLATLAFGAAVFAGAVLCIERAYAEAPSPSVTASANAHGSERAPMHGDGAHDHGLRSGRFT